VLAVLRHRMQWPVLNLAGHASRPDGLCLRSDGTCADAPIRSAAGLRHATVLTALSRVLLLQPPSPSAFVELQDAELQAPRDLDFQTPLHSPSSLTQASTMRRTESPTTERFDNLAILQHRMEMPVAYDIKGIIVSQHHKHLLELDAQVADEGADETAHQVGTRTHPAWASGHNNASSSETSAARLEAARRRSSGGAVNSGRDHRAERAAQLSLNLALKSRLLQPLSKAPKLLPAASCVAPASSRAAPTSSSSLSGRGRGAGGRGVGGRGGGQANVTSRPCESSEANLNLRARHSVRHCESIGPRTKTFVSKKEPRPTHLKAPRRGTDASESCAPRRMLDIELRRIRSASGRRPRSSGSDEGGCLASSGTGEVDGTLAEQTARARQRAPPQTMRAPSRSPPPLPFPPPAARAAKTSSGSEPSEAITVTQTQPPAHVTLQPPARATLGVSASAKSGQVPLSPSKGYVYMSTPTLSQKVLAAGHIFFECVVIWGEGGWRGDVCTPTEREHAQERERARES
jgi:hypothetical protein